LPSENAWRLRATPTTTRQEHDIRICSPKKIDPPAVKAAGQSMDGVGSRRSPILFVDALADEAGHVASVQGVAASLVDAVMRGRSIKLRELGLQVLVNQQ
jgi:hypothetical protein